ncbi:hypothetical protein K2173_015332 [Erythroxylum novogranatense]|uniref:Basic blue protein n=1 Tax=Erythroxylum novogranatense TaxID=1862640 RepID=A0AAV8SS22_9ROSI|nr:hypothetical protein K2173_015332 [Erythroxylum novogranatense]
MERGSAMLAIALLCVLLFRFQICHAATYNVGGSSNWSFNVAGWPAGQSFKAGDVLVFNYSANSHNVVVVNKAGYDSCNTPPGSKIYTSGKDQITLAKGQNYFICNFPGHCEANMKIAINAA